MNYYVYMIRSLLDTNVTYVGYTVDLKQRLETHNTGGSVYTAKYRPWQLVTYVVFSNQPSARKFEKYLKTPSGKSFAQKRFW